MMGNGVQNQELAKRYAGALFSTASENGTLDRVQKDIEVLGSFLDSSGPFRDFIRTPALTRDQRQEIVGEIAGKAGFCKETANFLELLAVNMRLFALPEMLSRFRTMMREKEGLVTAEVSTPSPLSDADGRRLSETLEKSFSKKVNLVLSEDPSLLGGIVVRVGSLMVDGSLKKKIQRLGIIMKGAL